MANNKGIDVRTVAGNDSRFRNVKIGDAEGYGYISVSEQGVKATIVLEMPGATLTQARALVGDLPEFKQVGGEWRYVQSDGSTFETRSKYDSRIAGFNGPVSSRKAETPANVAPIAPASDGVMTALADIATVLGNLNERLTAIESKPTRGRKPAAQS